MRNIILVLAALLIIAGAGLYVSKVRRAEQSNLTETPAEAKDRAWTVLQDYLSAAKAHDLEKLTALSYQTSPACKGKPATAECQTLMDNVAKIGESFKKEEFVNVAYDRKQIILSTDFHAEESDIARGFLRKVIIFTRDSRGNPKVLYFTQPSEITYVGFNPRGGTTTRAIADQRLSEMVKDQDGDTLPDEVETCSYMGATPQNCHKTDPNKKDSDGDGWWDSTESHFYP